MGRPGSIDHMRWVWLRWTWWVGLKLPNHKYPCTTHLRVEYTRVSGVWTCGRTLEPSCMKAWQIHTYALSPPPYIQIATSWYYQS